MRVIVGGTFGYLHRGHRELLAKAFEIGDSVYIGLTTEEYVRKAKNYKRIPNYSERESLLRKFVGRFGKKFEISPLNDKFGPSTTADFDAIVVTAETLPTALEINRIRSGSALKPLTIVKIGYVLSSDSVPISTSRIIRGEIDSKGNLIRRNKKHE